MDARFTLVLPTEDLKNYPSVKVTLVRSEGNAVESVLEAWLIAPFALPPTAVALSERRLFVCPARA